jgi:hypothetical protein
MHDALLVGAGVAALGALAAALLISRSYGAAAPAPAPEPAPALRPAFEGA